MAAKEGEMKEISVPSSSIGWLDTNLVLLSEEMMLRIGHCLLRIYRYLFALCLRSSIRLVQ